MSWLTRLLGLEPTGCVICGAPAKDDWSMCLYHAARRRWLESNEAARLEGCRCGRPATRFEVHPGTIGGVPHLSWSCDEHVGVQAWTRSGDGPWVPHTEVDADGVPL